MSGGRSDATMAVASQPPFGHRAVIDLYLGYHHSRITVSWQSENRVLQIHKLAEQVSL